MRVPLVENYAPPRESVAQALGEAGYAVNAPADGEEGLWHAQSGDHDAMVLDIVLPKLDGLSILERLRQRGRRTPVLLLTAKSRYDDARR
jgi:DNA-binding response OmpR family regulator